MANYHKKQINLLIVEFAKLKKIAPPYKEGLAKWGRENLDKDKLDGGNFTKMKNGKSFPFSHRYLDARFEESKNLEESNMISLDSKIIDAIAIECDYNDYNDFLSKKGCDNPVVKDVVQSKNLKSLKNSNTQGSNRFLDRYDIEVLYIPAILGLIPIIIWVLLLVDLEKNISNFIVFVSVILLIVAVIISSYLFSFFGKEYQKFYFRSKTKGYPTSYLMLYGYDSKYSEQEKNKYREELFAYFKIIFPKKEEELKDEKRALNVLRIAEERLRNNIRNSKITNSLIRHNLFRNLVPATFFGIITSMCFLVIEIWQVNLKGIITFSLVLLLFFISHLYLRYGQPFLKTAESYANYLLDEFLSR